MFKTFYELWDEGEDGTVENWFTDHVAVVQDDIIYDVVNKNGEYQDAAYLWQDISYMEIADAFEHALKEDDTKIDVEEYERARNKYEYLDEVMGDSGQELPIDLKMPFVQNFKLFMRWATDAKKFIRIANDKYDQELDLKDMYGICLDTLNDAGLDILRSYIDVNKMDQNELILFDRMLEELDVWYKESQKFAGYRFGQWEW